MSIFFGTDGWRAYIDSQINENTVEVVAQAFADFVKQKTDNRKVAIAYDTRRNSPLFATVFSQVLSGNGIQVLLSKEITPTPILSFTTKNENCFAGVMITASHNPPEYNGIKFKSRLGGPFSTEDTRKVERLLHVSHICKSDVNIAYVDMLPKYISHIEKIIDFSLIQRANLSLLIDSMGGAGTNILQKILCNKGCKANSIFEKPSETFHGRLAEPIEKNLAPLMKELSRGNYAFGVATDGDADRVGVCLDDGKWLSAQNTILLLVDYLIKEKKMKGGVVKTSSVSDKIRDCFETNDIPVHEVQVGFKYIADVMIREQIIFGGEESGGFGYGNHIPERDGIFSSLLLLEMLSASSFDRLSIYLESRQLVLGKIYYDRVDDYYDKADKNELLPWLYEENIRTVGNFKVEGVFSFLSSRCVINGLKFVFEGGCRWLLIRSSETENIIRYYAEGQTEQEVRNLLSLGKKIMVIK